MEKLLIVDDNSDIRQQLKWGLSEEYTVLLAGDVNEGLGVFKKNLPRSIFIHPVESSITCCNYCSTFHVRFQWPFLPPSFSST